MAQIMRFVCRRVENIVEKAAFSPFSTVFIYRLQGLKPWTKRKMSLLPKALKTLSNWGNQFSGYENEICMF